MSPAVQVLEAGKYNVQVTLKASNGESITSNTKVDLPVGTASPEVQFRARDIKDTLKVNDPYVVSKAFLRREDIDASATLDRALNLGNTAPYQIDQLQREAIEPSGAGSAVGVDTDSNGKFDFLDGSAVADQQPPNLSVSVTPNQLWPANHQMVEIKVNTQVSDNVDPNPSVGLVSITSNEGQNVKGDGNTATDIKIETDGRVFLRAERSGTGTGRIYTLTYSARDSAGNVTQATAQVKVPHSKGK